MLGLSTTPPRSSHRILPLDVLRGIAVLLVLVHHGIIEPQRTGMLSGPLTILTRFGWTGVDLFFVLSGFLVGGLLMSEIKARGVPDVKRFFIRRLFKIWPTYYVYLAWSLSQRLPAELARAGDGTTWRSGLTSVASAARGTAAALGSLWPNFLHVQNFVITDLRHTWTLAVEEHFYLFLPLLLTLLCRTGRSEARSRWSFEQRFMASAGAVIVVPIVLRVLSAGHVPSDWLYHLTFYRMDSLFFGVLLAYLSQFRPELIGALLKHRFWMLAVGTACLIPAFRLEASDPFIGSLGYTLLYVGYGSILLVLVNLKPDSGYAARVIWGPAGRAIGSVGFYSYAIYLWHNYLVRPWFSKLIEGYPLSILPLEIRVIVGYLGYFTVAYMVGRLASTVVEQPMLRLRDRIFPSRGRIGGAEYEAEPRVVRPVILGSA